MRPATISGVTRTLFLDASDESDFPAWNIPATTTTFDCKPLAP